MRDRLGAPAMVIAVIALFAAIAGGYAIGAAKIKTKGIANQAVTNKKIKKNTIKGNRVDEASLSGAGTGLSVFQTGQATVPASTATATPVLTLQVPKAGSYLFISKAVLAKAGAPDPVQCLLSAGGDSDRSLAYVSADSNETVVNTLPHTFSAAGTAVLACDNPAVNPLFVTDKRISAIPLGALSNTAG